MRKTNLVKRAILAIAAMATIGFSATAQEADSTESIFSTDAGLDIYSSYVWRGSKFGTGPAFQPWVEQGIGGLAIGAWGSVNAGMDEAVEMDLYIGYSFDFGLSLTVTDYYFGGYEDSTGTFLAGEYFDYENAHYIEPMVGYEIGDLSITAAYMLAPGGEEGDMYFELGYVLGQLEVALGAGDGAYTSDGEFSLCNISLGTSKEIEITDKFSLPVSGAAIINPSTETFNIAVGISF